MFDIHSESVFGKLSRIVTVGGLQTPLGPALADDVLIEDAVQMLHQKAIDSNYDPVDRVSLVICNGQLRGWIRFDFLSVSEKRLVREEVLSFGERQIASADTSVINIVNLFKDTNEQLFFILHQNQISGTVRYADIFSPEFRLCLFALSLELEEAALRTLILYPENSFTVLSNARQNMAKEVFSLRYPGRQMDWVSLLKCTTFIDKGMMILKSNVLKQWSASNLKKLFTRIERIRNHSAHPSGNRSEWLVLSQPKVLADTIINANLIIGELDNAKV